MQLAYVLVNTEEFDSDLMKVLRRIKGVEEAFALYGVYDIIVKNERRNHGQTQRNAQQNKKTGKSQTDINHDRPRKLRRIVTFSTCSCQSILSVSHGKAMFSSESACHQAR